MEVPLVLSDSSTLVIRINQLALSMIQEPFFRPKDMPPRAYTCAEAGFLRAVAWLYALYQEAGTVNLAFALTKFQVFNLERMPPYSQHVRTIHALRTSLQHSLDLASERNLQLRMNSDSWILRVTGTECLTNENDWRKCLVAIENESSDFLEGIYTCVQRIMSDAYRDILIRDWKFQLARYHAPHEFDRVISIAANDLGFEHLDLIRFRNQHYDKWIRWLDSLAAGYNFDKEVRGLVEQTLLTHQPIPVNGEDVIKELGVSPGVQVRIVLERARQLYLQSPCSRTELMHRLKNEIHSQ